MIAGKKTSVAALMLLVTGAAFIPAMAFLPSLGRAKTAGSICTLRATPEISSHPILITGNNVELTGPLTDYVNKKIGHTLEKLGAPVTKVDVHLSVNKNPRISEGHVAEVTTFAKGFVIRATEKSESMYASVDLVADRLARKLRKYKERVVHSRRARASTSDLAAAAEEMWEDALPNGVTDVADEYSDNVVPQADMSVVKEKKFPMPPCTVEDAVTCLDFLDHDFYVFRNAETSEINVVYKRNHGGVGLIQPERD